LAGLLRTAIGGALLVCSLPAWAGGVLCEPPYNFGLKNGPDTVLCEIQATAKRFLDQHNANNETDWEPFGPDYRIWVPPCQVPLRATWTAADGKKRVLVTCKRTAPSAVERKWAISVDVVGKSLQQNHFILEAARKFIRRENAKHKSHWLAWTPSEPPMVPKCAVPLSVRWHAKNSKSEVDVICREAVETTWGKSSWRVRIPVA
jgi:hypothetical protein